MKQVFTKMKVTADHVLKAGLYSVLIFCIVLFISMLLSSCNTTRKALSKNSSTAHIEETISKDSSFTSSNDSVQVKRDSTSKKVSIDSAYDSFVTIEEELFRDSVVMTYKRKTMIYNKGRYVFESLEDIVKADSVDVRKAVNVVKKDLIIKDSSHIYTSYAKDVKRARVPWSLVLLFFALFVVYLIYKKIKL